MKKYIFAGVTALVCAILALLVPTLTLVVLAAACGFALIIVNWREIEDKLWEIEARHKVRAEARKARITTDASGVTETDVTESDATTPAVEPTWRRKLTQVKDILIGAFLGVLGGAIVAALVMFGMWWIADQFAPTQAIRTVVTVATWVIWVIIPIIGVLLGVLATTKEKK